MLQMCTEGFLKTSNFANAELYQFKLQRSKQQFFVSSENLLSGQHFEHKTPMMMTSIDTMNKSTAKIKQQIFFLLVNLQSIDQ